MSVVFIVVGAVILVALIVVGTWKWSGVHDHEQVTEPPPRRPSSAVRILDDPDEIRAAKDRAAARERELHGAFLDRMDRYQT